jgi:hypothetical protein
MSMKRASAGRRWIWIFLGASAYALHLALGKDSVLGENVYARGLFVGLRWLWDRTLGASPVPLLYIFLAVAVLWDVWALWKWRRSREHVPEGYGPGHLWPDEHRTDVQAPAKRAPSVLVKIGRGLLLMASWAGTLVVFFYVLWGFNYNRVGLETQLHLEVRPLDLAAVKAEAEEAARAIAEARASVPGATKSALGGDALPHDLEAKVRNSLSEVLAEAGFPVTGRPRVRPLWPGGLLMRFSSTGFYFPYCGEGYIADNLTAAEKPFVTAHEMVHAYGITDEGAANLLSFLACSSSDDPFIRYSGLLSFWNYVFAELARLSREDAKGLAARLPEGARADIRAAFENWDRYRGPLRAAAQTVYGRYLKSQGIAEGLKSYDRFVSLVAAWRRGSKK